MKKRSLLPGAVSLILAVLIIEPWLTSFSTHQPTTFRPRTLSCSAPLHPPSLLSDFDGDNLPDEGELLSKGQHKSIRVSLSSAAVTYLPFDSQVYERGQLVSGDIDHDNDQDLVWYSQTTPQEVVFWLNDGKGSFGQATSYQPSEQQAGLNLNPLLNQDAETGFSNQEPLSETLYALRTADSPAINLTGRQALPAASVMLTAHRSTLCVQSSCLKAIRQRGPPARLS